RVKIRWHDDRWQPGQLAPWTQDALTHLATVSGATTQALVSALPAFGAAADRRPDPGPPARTPPDLPSAWNLAAGRRAAPARHQPVPGHPGSGETGALRRAPALTRADDPCPDQGGTSHRRPDTAARPPRERRATCVAAENPGDHRGQSPGRHRGEPPRAVPGSRPP